MLGDWGPARGRRQESTLTAGQGITKARQEDFRQAVEGNECHHGTVAGQPGTQPDSWPEPRNQAHGVSGSFQHVLVHAQDLGRDPHLVSLSEGCPLVWSTTCI